MHELSIAQEIVSIVKEQVDAVSMERIKTIHLRVGKLTAILPESLNFCFDAITEKTPLETASLDITVVPFTLRCDSCEHSFEPEGWDCECPNCGSIRAKATTGSELEISAIELIDEKAEVL